MWIFADRRWKVNFMPHETQCDSNETVQPVAVAKWVVVYVVYWDARRAKSQSTSTTDYLHSDKIDMTTTP